MISEKEIQTNWEGVCRMPFYRCNLGQSGGKEVIKYNFSISAKAYYDGYVNISSIPEYQKLTPNDIYVVNVSEGFERSQLGGEWTSFSAPHVTNYDINTGVVTISSNTAASQRARTINGTLIILK